MQLNAQSLFPDLQYSVYLSHASISPLNVRTAKAMQDLILSYTQIGMKALMPGLKAREDLRNKLAKLVGTEAQNIGLTLNTSHGALVVAEEFPWSEGDHIVLVEGEFPGNVTPWLNAARRHGLKVDWLKIDDLLEENQAFVDVMSRGPRMMAVSWVQYQTGIALDLADLARWRKQYGVTVCVDAIQGLGGLAMDLAQTPLDFVICGGHKWLMGPEGAGFVYVSPQWQGKLDPVLTGWLSQERPIDFLIQGAGHVDYHKAYRPSPDRTEFATMSNVLFAGLAASIGLLLEADPKQTQMHVPKLAQHLRDGMQQLGLPVNQGRHPSGIASAAMASPRMQQVLKHLDEAGISATGPDGNLRFAPHFYQTREQMDETLEKLAAILKFTS